MLWTGASRSTFTFLSRGENLQELSEESRIYLQELFAVLANIMSVRIENNMLYYPTMGKFAMF